MAPLDRIRRLLQLVELLQSGRVLNSAQLANFCGVTRRTVFRDVDTLRESGIAVRFDEQRQGYTMPSNLILPAADFSLPETLSLLVLCHELGDEKTGIPFQQPGRTAALKLLSNLPHHLREYIGARTQAISVRIDARNPSRDAAPYFELLSRAIAERRQVRIRYKSLAEATEIVTALSAYRMLFSRRSWYVIGRSSIHRAVRTFNVARILSAELIPAHYAIPQRFSLDRYLGNAWHLIRERREHAVVVRFQKKVASNVAEVHWHKNQRIRWNKDGSLDFHVTVDGLSEIVWWILGYGDQAEVLEPPELRQRVADHLVRLAEIYKRELEGKRRDRRFAANGRKAKRGKNDRGEGRYNNRRQSRLR